MNYLQEVEKFHRLFNHPVLNSPAVPDAKRQQLRYNLIREELEELKSAMEKGNLIEVADALCDLQYVLSGTILEFGLQEKFPELFAEVQRSNMSKACTSIPEAEHTIAHHEALGDADCHYEEKEGKFLVFRTKDMKTMKSINYSPADLKKILL